MAGIPAGVLGRLRFAETSALVQRIVAGERWLASEGNALSGALHEVIGTVGSGPLKSRLVGLRRALHRLRAPEATEWSPAIRAALPLEVAERVERWLSRLQDVRDSQRQLPLLLAGETGRMEAALRNAAADPGFRRALQQSSPPLSDALDRWLSDSRKPRRQSVARLAKYLSRAATKTSPYSAFAVSGMGAWEPSSEALRITPNPELRGVLELYGHRRDRLQDALLRQPELWESTPVRMNPSLTDQGRYLRFLGRPPGEPLLAVPATPALRECLRLLHTRGHATLKTLRDQLAAVGATAPPVVARFLSHLVEIGLLEASPPGSTVAELATWVERAGGDRLAAVAHGLRGLADDLTAAVPVSDVGHQRARLESLRRTAGALTSRLGVATAADDRRLLVPGEALVHDSVICTGVLAACGVDAWQPALEDLDRLRRWLAILEPTLALKLALSELWRTQFRPTGPMPFLDFHRSVQEYAAGSGSAPAELRRLLAGGVAGPEAASSQFALVQELYRLQRRAWRPLRPQEGSGVAFVDPAVLAGVATSWPGWVRPIGSLGCYVQPLPAAGGLGLVVNATTVGHGQLSGRLAHLQSLAGEPRDLAPASAGMRLAELAGPHGSSLNDRVPTVPYEIDYPFTVARHASQQQLSLPDLVVDEEPDSGLLRLHSIRLGEEVTALALGLLMVPALPPAARLLVQAFGASPTIQFRRVPRRAPPDREVRRLPRVVVGRLVLYRAAWITGIASTPIRAPGERDTDYLLRLTRWRVTAGIPSRCFVRALPAHNGGPMLDKARKPVYVDFDNWFLVQALENMLRPPAEVLVFEEALPDPEGLERAVELLVEIGEG